MTKDRYYEMCDALGSEPIPEEVPVELEDLPELVRQSLDIYWSLRDDWDYMAGNYIGKSLINLFEVFSLFKVEEHEKLLVYRIMSMIDNERRTLIRAKTKTS